MPVIMSRFPLFTFDPSAYQIAMRDWQQHQEERVFGGNDVSYKLKKMKIRYRFVIVFVFVLYPSHTLRKRAHERSHSNFVIVLF